MFWHNCLQTTEAAALFRHQWPVVLLLVMTARHTAFVFSKQPCSTVPSLSRAITVAGHHCRGPSLLNANKLTPKQQHRQLQCSADCPSRLCHRGDAQLRRHYTVLQNLQLHFSSSLDSLLTSLTQWFMWQSIQHHTTKLCLRQRMSNQIP